MEDINIKEQGIKVFKAVLDNKASVTASQVITELKEGKADPVYVSIILKKFAKIQEEVFKDADIKNMTITEVSKHFEKNKKTAELFGAKITLASGGFWDYSTTDDPYLQALEDIEKEVKDLIKTRKTEIEAKATEWHKENMKVNPISPSEAFGENDNIKTSFGIKSFNLMYDRLPYLKWEDTIEVIETNPPVKRGADQLRFTV